MTDCDDRIKIEVDQELAEIILIKLIVPKFAI
jgi:hypothetical protein